MPREVLHLGPDDARRVPWKNGRGVTEELVLFPDYASFERGDFDWRVSKAAVDADGAFSSFPGFERILVVTRGEGLVLTHGDEASRARLRALDPYRFSGDWSTVGTLVRGAVSDFNVIFRRDVVEAQVEVLRLGRRRALETADAPHVFVHALAGGVTARVTGEEEPFELDEGDSLWVREARASEELELAGASEGCVVLLVRVGPSRG
ncbi:MAG: HutD family protein [Planctomycetes bacterium]|nr:HutD family protein [Planctomycetota bacterium]